MLTGTPQGNLMQGLDVCIQFAEFRLSVLEVACSYWPSIRKDQEKETAERSKPSEVEAVSACCAFISCLSDWLISWTKPGELLASLFSSIAAPHQVSDRWKALPGLYVQGGLTYGLQGKQQRA